MPLSVDSYFTRLDIEEKKKKINFDDFAIAFGSEKKMENSNFSNKKMIAIIAINRD
jgi:hypothetical protein